MQAKTWIHILAVAFTVLTFQACQTASDAEYTGFACASEPGTWRGLPDCTLSPVRQAEAVSDSIFFTFVSSFIVRDGRIYIPHGDRGQLLVADTTFRLVRTIGRKGKGPGEFGQPDFLDLSPAGWLWADGHGRGFLAHDTLGQLLAAVKHPGFMISRFFADAQNRLWLSIPGETQGDILVIDTSGQIVKGIANRFAHVPERLTEKRSHCDLLKGPQGTFFAISDSEGIIRKFDLDGNLLAECNLRTLPLIERYFEECQRIRQNYEGNPDQLTLVLFNDAAVAPGSETLYLLMFYHDDQLQTYCDRILVLDFSACQPLGTLQLTTPTGEDPCFLSIATDGNRLYAYDSNSASFFTYALPGK